MQSVSRGELFVVTLKSIEKLDEKMVSYEATLEISNLAVDQAMFQTIIEDVFSEDRIEVFSGFFKISRVVNAETLTDGEHDFTDVEGYLEKIADEIINVLQSTQGWGDPGSADLLGELTLLD